MPETLLRRAFSRQEALQNGISARMLQHPRFELVFPSVYVLAGTRLDALGLIDAAALALPDDAQPSHLTRMRRLGVDYGPPTPLHFTIGRDHHLDLADVFLHRTAAMPPVEAGGVVPEAAFIGAAATLRLIDLVKIGDWLLHRQHMTIASLIGLARAQPWRPGAGAAVAVVPHLEERSRSLKESETRLVLVFSGLPRPEVNRDVLDANGFFIGCGDLTYRLWKLLIEYEGRQHAFDDAQFSRDIDRYAGFRGSGWEYVQVTQARLERPRSLATFVHQRLVERGYDGPPPVFGRRWRSLFSRPVPAPLLHAAVDPQP
ncbi:hypothetical protein [Aeromicrobium sp. NPDC092404]|uniref:hypothetical protein n=1 Tax=Aeromicrobium sp. NPDC092404 TaxID=3154976 RepID=UPI00344727B8